MKKKIQNKLGTYLAVTAGVGCVSSVAEAAIVVVDLSGLTTSHGAKAIPGGDLAVDFLFSWDPSSRGFLGAADSAGFHSGGGFFFPGYGFVGGAYQGSSTSLFPTALYDAVMWSFLDSTGGGFEVGENWVAFNDTDNRFGWMSFTLRDLGTNDTLPITSFGKFVYDPASTSPATAITLQAAVAAAAIPEPSSLVLLALGATGLAARRQRKKAA